jgi:hypothetical protein
MHGPKAAFISLKLICLTVGISVNDGAIATVGVGEITTSVFLLHPLNNINANNNIILFTIDIITHSIYSNVPK